MQEILLASKRKLLHGNSELSWNEYIDLARSVGHCSEVQKLFMPFYRQGNNDDNSWKHSSSASQTPYDFLKLLDEFSDNNCTLPHDHVYGILALLGDVDSFPVDYKSGLVELFVNTVLFGVKTQVDLSPEHRISTSLVHFVNRLMRKMRHIPLVRIQGPPSVKIPDVSTSIRFNLKRQWGGIAPPTNQLKMMKRSNIGDAQLNNYCRIYFPSCDVFHYDPFSHVVLAIRSSLAGGLILGRIAYGSLRMNPPCEPEGYWPRDTQMVISEHYSDEGLHGAIIKLDSICSTIVFSDIRAAVILLALPDVLEFRKIAIGMLSEVDGQQSFKDTRFSSYKGSPDETEHNAVASVIEFDPIEA